MAALTLSDASHLHALAWLTTLARAFVLPVLGSALVLIVAPRLPRWARRLGPALVRAALVLLVLAAYGPVAGDLTLWGPEDTPLYRLASLVVLVCALALVIVLPLLAEGLRAPGAAPMAAQAALPAPLATAAPRREPAPERPQELRPPVPCPPFPGRQLSPRSVYPSATFAAALARPHPTPSPGLPFVTAEVVPIRALASRQVQPVPARLVATRLEEAARTLEEDEAAPPPAQRRATDAHLGPRASLTPPRIAPVRPDETVRVPSPRPPAAPVEPLPPTHAMPPAAQARLLAATAGPRVTPLQARLRRGVGGLVSE